MTKPLSPLALLENRLQDQVNDLRARMLADLEYLATKVAQAQRQVEVGHFGLAFLTSSCLTQLPRDAAQAETLVEQVRELQGLAGALKAVL